VDGVALATTLSQGISAVLCVRNLMRRTDACRLELKKMRIYKPELLKMIRIGLPAGIQNGMFSISNVIIQSSINSFGPAFVNGNSAAANIEGFMWVFSNAFQQASLNFVGQNHGANQPKRAAKALWLCLGSAFTVCLTLGLLASYFGEALLGIYITDSPDAIAYGLIRVARVFPVYFLFGLMDSTTGALRGRGASLAPMLISIVGICGIRLGWIFTIFRIPAYRTPESLYLSFPLSWAVTFCCLLIAFLVITQRAKRKEAPTLAST
jgi:Na+-driven multidrug efflux pump